MKAVDLFFLFYNTSKFILELCVFQRSYLHLFYDYRCNSDSGSSASAGTWTGTWLRTIIISSWC